MILTFDAFKKCLQEIVDFSNEIIDGWKLIEDKEGCYITKSSHISTGITNLILLIEYHIVYSISYSVPILCFNIFHKDGSLLETREAWKYFKFYDTDDLMSTLTQLDHPILNRPFITLHPCQTQHILETSFKDSDNPVLSWLSAVGPVVRLDISIEYAKLTHK